MWETILNVALAVLSVCLACLSYYLDIKRKIVEQASGEIADAEDTGMNGAEKMAYVVEHLKRIIPKAVRFIFTDAVIEKIAQKAFDKIEEYAKKQK